MKIVQIMLAVVSALLVASNVICGMWINSKGSELADIASSIGFHRTLGIATLVSVVLTMVFSFLRK